MSDILQELRNKHSIREIMDLNVDDALDILAKAVDGNPECEVAVLVLQCAVDNINLIDAVTDADGNILYRQQNKNEPRLRRHG